MEKQKRYEVMFMDGHNEIMNQEEVEDLIYELESFEREDVNMIDEVDENGEFVRSVWTEEEGLFVNI